MLRRLWRRRLAYNRIGILLAVVGPGIIAASADNDASGILGYSQAGAVYKYGLLWILALSTLALAVAQEICARMGAVTGKGLADLIREEYGPRITVFAMLVLLVANFATTVSEFAGILSAVQVFAGPWIRFVAVPLTALAVWLFVTRGSYRRIERILLGLSLVYLAYIVSAFLAHPPWLHVLKETVAPNLRATFAERTAHFPKELAGVSPLSAYVLMIINVVGTTITPWGQFYIQSTVRDKGVKAEEYGYTRIDVLAGAFFTNFIAFFIVVCCAATLFPMLDLNDAGQAALALAPFAGKLATILFAIGLFNASCFGAITVPLSTAYAVTEALGWESGLGRRVREAPLFIGIFTLLIVASAGIVVVVPTEKLGFLITLPNYVGGLLLPIILVLMQLLVNKRRLMGNYVNGRGYNWLAWITAVALIALSLMAAWAAIKSMVSGG